MPLIVLGNYPYADGTTPNGQDLMEDLYDAATLNSSFETMNGGLDSLNADAAWTKIQQDQIQDGTFTSARAVAGTASLDWFPPDWFYGAPVTTVFPEVGTFWKAIPGANQTFFLPWNAVVIFTWSVVWGGEMWDNNHPAYIGFLLDGEWDVDNAAQRFIGRSMWRQGEDTVFAHWGEVKNRHWNGHLTKELQAGWHTAGLHIVADGKAVTNESAITIVQAPGENGLGADHINQEIHRPACRQVRTWVRSFKHIAFRKDNV